MAQSQPISRPVVLVVEDEPLQRMMAVDLVLDAGYDVLEAWSADEAVTILESRSDIRIVFTDVDMPGSMDGIMLASAIRDRWPPIHIIVTSGHMRMHDAVLPPRSVFFSKPYDGQKVTAQMNRMAALN
jgi:CheY-like chemotaxis protein